jgi:hypothetical protein
MALAAAINLTPINIVQLLFTIRNKVGDLVLVNPKFRCMLRLHGVTLNFQNLTTYACFNMFITSIFHLEI